MLVPPKEKEEIKKQEIIGETAPDKSISETDEPKQEPEKIDTESEQITNEDDKITNDDELHDENSIVN